MPRPTAERVRELLDYDQNTGTFVWKVQPSARRVDVGLIAGCTSLHRSQISYRSIGVDGGQHLAHRLAVLWMTGEWPNDASDVDHIDGDGLNNAWANLRVVTKSINRWNTVAPPCHNTSGVRGVHWSKPNRKWAAQIQVHGRVRFLGYFTDIDEASAAYQAARCALHGGPDIYGVRAAAKPW